jgi:hypothetical protein
MTENLKVFVCHASENLTTAKELVDRLKSDGFEPWLDSEKILPGMTWDLEIQKTMRSSDAVIVCFSKVSIEKEGYIQKEIKFAAEIQKEKPEGTIFLIPMQLEECEIPYSLKDVQWGRYFEADGYERIVKALNQRASQLQRKVAKQKSSNLSFENQVFQLEDWLSPLLVQQVDGSQSLITGQSLISALNDSLKTVLIGQSGSGKTNLLKLTCNELNKSGDRRCCLIPLKNYSKSLSHTIKQNLNWNSIQDDQVISILEQQNITLLLDGLNEVTTKDRDDCIKEIDALLGNYQGYVCVSYVISDMVYFGFDYPVFKVLPLSKKDIENTIKNYFRVNEVPSKADWFLQSVRGWEPERQQDFDNLASLPINLQFMLELALDSNFLYSSLGDLYGQVIQKRLERTKLYNYRNQVSTDLKTDCLMGLAYQSILQDHQLQMQKEFVRTTFVESLNSTKVEADLALSEIIRAGLLIEVNDFLLEWPHSSFRDYLAGRHLFNLLEADEAIDDFPLDKPTGIMAAAHATRLLTMQTRKIDKRNLVFKAVLARNPSLKALKTIAEEYHPPINYYVSTNQEVKYEEGIFTREKWGERFIETYNRIKEICQENGIAGIENIPVVRGLNLYFNIDKDFCLMMFSHDPGIDLGDLEILDQQLSHRSRRKNSKTGFCMFAPFLSLLDPEIMAYWQVGLWLKHRSTVDQKELDDWHIGLATYISPNHDWINWGNQDFPNNDFEICAPQRDAVNFIIKHYGIEQFNQMAGMVDIVGESKKEILNWNEIYMPITFEVNPTKIHEEPRLASGRNGQVMLRTLPDHNISLLLFVPFMASIQKLDFGSRTYIPFPISVFNRFYFIYYQQEMFREGKLSTFVHLRG